MEVELFVFIPDREDVAFGDKPLLLHGDAGITVAREDLTANQLSRLKVTPIAKVINYGGDVDDPGNLFRDLKRGDIVWLGDDVKNSTITESWATWKRALQQNPTREILEPRKYSGALYYWKEKASVIADVMASLHWENLEADEDFNSFLIPVSECRGVPDIEVVKKYMGTGKLRWDD